MIQKLLALTFSARRSYGVITLVFVLTLLSIKLALIFFGLVDTERGDASVYLFEGAFLDRNLYFSSLVPWLNIHPPLPQILSGLIFAVYTNFFVESSISYVQLSLAILSSIYALSSG
jgi:hypothetical protein